jgi:hypothetical protein
MNVMTPVVASETESEKLGRFALDLALASSRFDFGESILGSTLALGETSLGTPETPLLLSEALSARVIRAGRGRGPALARGG